MKAFEVGETDGVLHMDDRRETVTIAARDGSIVRFSDGRTARVLAGIAPDSTDEECIRLGEVGPVATGGIVRVCHRIAATEINPTRGQADE